MGRERKGRKMIGEEIEDRKARKKDEWNGWLWVVG